MVKKRKNKHYLVKIIALLMLITIIYLQNEGYINLNETLSNLILDNQRTQFNVEENLTSSLEIAFCPSSKCQEIIIESFSDAKYEILCAFYELDNINLTKKLKEKSQEGIHVSIVIDDRYLNEEALEIIKNTNVKLHSDIKRNTRYNNYMHSKFCVIDEKTTITGSANPTTNGFYKNNNNILKIESSYISQNYKQEFLQLENNIFGQNKKDTLSYNNITLNYNNESYFISTFMCPQNNCDEIIITHLNSAQKSIKFAVFAITHDTISQTLIEKSKNNVNVTGVIEKRNINLQGSDVIEMQKYFNLYNDTNKNNMHHKFFIIDEKTIITGSMNPSNSGSLYNDENIIIIENKKLAQEFVKEFESLI